MTERADWAAWFQEKMGGDVAAFHRKRWVYNTPIWNLIVRRFPEGARIIECGSGTGLYAAQMAHFGYDVTGVELDPEMLAFAERHAEEKGIEGVRFVPGDILRMQDHYGKYDLTFSSGVVEHFYHDDAVKVLRQQGRCAPYVLVVVPSKYPWKKVAHKTQGIFERYTYPRLQRLVADAELEHVETLAYSAGNRVGRAIELLAPPVVADRVFPHFASTIGIFARSPHFMPAEREASTPRGTEAT